MLMKEIAEKSNISGKNMKTRLPVKLFGFARRPPIWQLIISSFLLNFVIEVLGRHSLIEAVSFVFKSPVQFLLGTLIIGSSLAISFLFGMVNCIAFSMPGSLLRASL